MKKSFCLVLCLFLLLFCTACNNTEEPNDPTLWQLTKQTTLQNDNVTVTIFTYNELGQQVSYEIRANGVVNSTNELAYDNNGYKNYEKSTNVSGLITEIFYTNDSEGKITSQRTVITFQENSFESVSEFEYTDDYGSYVQTFVSGSSKGNTITVTKDEHGNELAHITSNSTSIRYENKYNGTILVERIASRSTSSGTVVTKIVYEYDENGNNVKTTSYDELGTIFLTQLYEYTAVNTSQ